MIGVLIEALTTTFGWPVIIFIIIGYILGIFIGMIPGIGPAVGMTLVLPFTIVLEPISAILLLSCIYMGGAYGGAVSAILFNVPGTGAAAATTFDGYPMARKGLALNALAISAMASSIGGIIAVVFLFISVPIVIPLVLSFGSAEFVLVAFLGLTLIAIAVQGSIVKSITAGLMGILTSTIGVAAATPEVRYNFDVMLLFDGINLIAVILGLFAISEMISLSGESGGIAKRDIQLGGSILAGIKTVYQYPIKVIKGSLVGLVIGMIPGAGASMANFISYAEAMNSSEDKSMFGDGDPRGLIAAETANNAAVGGSFIPTLSFGIPGSVLSAILLGALIMHGLRPGPNLYNANLDITLSIYLALAIGSIIIIPIIGLLIVTRLEILTQIDTRYIIPIVISLSLFGVYAIRFNWIDVLAAIFFGYLGYFMFKYGYSVIAFLLGMILGPIAEDNLFRALQLSDGSLLIFVDSFVGKVMVLGIFLLLIIPSIKIIKGQNTT